MGARFLPIYRRELKSYLTSPAFYVAVAIFFFLTGLVFCGILLSFSEMSGNAEYRKEMGFEEINFTRHVVSQVFWSTNFFLMFVVPILTMRLIAEEKRTGTYEVLTSLPFTDWNIVLGKFLAAYTLVALMQAGSAYYAFIMIRFGTPELPVMAVAFVGGLVVAAAYVAIGLFASSLTESQIVAAILGFVLLLVFYLMSDVIPGTATGVGKIVEHLSLRYHSEQFTHGLLRLEDIAYFLMMVGAFLFLTCRSLEIRRWKI
ncbi:MAG: ABC transporter permease [Candidatus Sumerlaeaceae bacterium]|nr:ABC transporter permease [Candidatus Sumerlaeaceae bacterium]